MSRSNSPFHLSASLLLKENSPSTKGSPRKSNGSMNDIVSLKSEIESAVRKHENSSKRQITQIEYKIKFIGSECRTKIETLDTEISKSAALLTELNDLVNQLCQNAVVDLRKAGTNLGSALQSKIKTDGLNQIKALNKQYNQMKKEIANPNSQKFNKILTKFNNLKSEFETFSDEQSEFHSNYEYQISGVIVSKLNKLEKAADDLLYSKSSPKGNGSGSSLLMSEFSRTLKLLEREKIQLQFNKQKIFKQKTFEMAENDLKRRINDFQRQISMCSQRMKHYEASVQRFSGVVQEIQTKADNWDENIEKEEVSIGTRYENVKSELDTLRKLLDDRGVEIPDLKSEPDVNIEDISDIENDEEEEEEEEGEEDDEKKKKTNSKNVKKIKSKKGNKNDDDENEEEDDDEENEDDDEEKNRKKKKQTSKETSKSNKVSQNKKNNKENDKDRENEKNEDENKLKKEKKSSKETKNSQNNKGKKRKNDDNEEEDEEEEEESEEEEENDKNKNNKKHKSDKSDKKDKNAKNENKPEEKDNKKGTKKGTADKSGTKKKQEEELEQLNEAKEATIEKVKDEWRLFHGNNRIVEEMVFTEISKIDGILNGSDGMYLKISAAEKRAQWCVERVKKWKSKQEKSALYEVDDKRLIEKLNELETKVAEVEEKVSKLGLNDDKKEKQIEPFDLESIEPIEVPKPPIKARLMRNSKKGKRDDDNETNKNEENGEGKKTKAKEQKGKKVVTEENEEEEEDEEDDDDEEENTKKRKKGKDQNSKGTKDNKGKSKKGKRNDDDDKNEEEDDDIDENKKKSNKTSKKKSGVDKKAKNKEDEEEEEEEEEETKENLEPIVIPKKLRLTYTQKECEEFGLT